MLKFIKPILSLAIFFTAATAFAQQPVVPTTASPAPSSNSGSPAITPKISLSGDTLVAKAAPGYLYHAQVVSLTATAGFILLFNATSEPADGAVTPVWCKRIAASGEAEIDPPFPLNLTIGVVISVSSGSDCSTKTTGVISATIEAEVQ